MCLLLIDPLMMDSIEKLVFLLLVLVVLPSAVDFDDALILCIADGGDADAGGGAGGWQFSPFILAINAAFSVMVINRYFLRNRVV